MGRTFAVALCIFAFVIATSSASDFMRQLETLVGKPIDVAIARLGPADKIEPTGTGNRHTWKRTVTIRTQMRSTRPTGGNITMTDQRARKATCTLLIDSDKTGLVIEVDYEGSRLACLEWIGDADF